MTQRLELVWPGKDKFRLVPERARAMGAWNLSHVTASCFVTTLLLEKNRP